MKQRPPRPYSQICLIANPKSSNGGQAVAQRLAKQLRAAITEAGKPAAISAVTVRLTKRAGHASQLAQQALAKDSSTLLVSVSGDGGYHEVINGAMASGTRRPICAVYGAGHANDHHQHEYGGEGELVERIVSGRTRPLDLIGVHIKGRQTGTRGKTRATGSSKSSRSVTRFAHSYVGLGLSAVGAKRSDQFAKGSLSEFRLALEVTANAEPVSVRFGRRTNRYDSILFFNIGRMAKYVRTRRRHSAGDGQLGMVRVKHGSRLRRFWILFQAATVGLRTRRIKRITFTVEEPALLQLDGEVSQLAAGTTLTITSRSGALRTF